VRDQRAGPGDAFHRPAFEAVPSDVVAGEGTVEPVGVSESEADAGQVAPVHASDEDAR
jgi:hypothetical protein